MNAPTATYVGLKVSFGREELVDVLKAEANRRAAEELKGLGPSAARSVEIDAHVDAQGNVRITGAVVTVEVEIPGGIEALRAALPGTQAGTD